MSLSCVSKESYSTLQAVLSKLLIKHEPAIKILDDRNLVILETNNDSVGFTFIGSDAEDEYKQAYLSFKQLFRENYENWNTHSISFVVCFTNHCQKEIYLNSIEMDVYFCRKYIVKYDSDATLLERELLKLPFLPVNEGKIAGVETPPSAQALMRGIGISSALSSYIITPRERSANRIIEDIANKKIILPEIKYKQISSDLSEKRLPELTRIKELTIKAFRGYNVEQHFDLDSDIVVLFGPNGLGKTSFFDALDFACTGRIGRLSKNKTRNITQDEFNDLACHLNCKDNNGFVKMKVCKDGLHSEIKRNVNEWSTAYVNTEPQDRSSILQILTSADWGDKKERIEHLERIFRATHLFSQTAPELLTDFEKDSRLSSDIVARTFALDDYATGLAKTDKIIEILNSQISRTEDKVNELQLQLKKVQQITTQIPEIQEDVEIGGHLRKLTEVLISDICSKTEINVEQGSQEITAGVVREWRSILEAKVHNAENVLTKMGYLETRFAQYEIDKQELEQIETALKIINDDMRINQLAYNESELERNSTQALITNITAELKVVENDLNNYNELKMLIERNDQVKSRFNKMNYELEQLKASDSDIRTKVSELVEKLEEIERYGDTLGKNHYESNERVNSYQKIIEGFKEFESNRRNLQQLNESRQAEMLTFEELKETQISLEGSIEKETEQFEHKELFYRDLMVNQTDLTNLLDQLEYHIDDGMCPVCGTNHDTREELVRIIRNQKATQPQTIHDAAEMCQTLRKSIANKKELLITVTHKIIVKQKELDELEVKIERNLSAISDYEKLLENVGASLAADNRIQTITSLCDEERLSLSSLKNKIEENSTLARKYASELDELKNTQGSIAYKVDTAKHDIDELRKEQSEIIEKVGLIGLSLDLSLPKLVAQQTVLYEKKNKMLNENSELYIGVEELSSTLAELTLNRNKLETKKNQLLQDKELLGCNISSYNNQAYAVMNTDKVVLGKIQSEQVTVRMQIQTLESLTAKTLTLERALDASQRSAMLAEAELERNGLIKQIDDFTSKVHQDIQQRKWFINLKDILRKESAKAVDGYVHAFGPITTLLQKRLRAVHGFGDVKLNSCDSEIRVEVDYQGKVVKPTDYFSDSQKQILMLSLFLSERISQTWSGFSPILLDDPVTHFDDLNAFCFVELIRGLVSTSKGQMQIFISTCEERLYDLMRQKFSDCAKYYRFCSITNEGPIIIGEN